MTITLTRDLAWAASWDAANRSMRAAGREAWSREDADVQVQEFNRLWPVHLELGGVPCSVCECPECGRVDT